MIGRDTSIEDRIVMRPIKVKTIFLVVKRSSVGLLIGANTMEYFGICAQPGVGSCTWGNQAWPARMAVATTPYHCNITKWALLYREEGNYDTIVSNVAHLTEDQEAQVQSAAEVAVAETTSDVAAQFNEEIKQTYFKHAYAETDGIDRLIEKDKAFRIRQMEEEERGLETVMEVAAETEEEEEFQKKDAHIPWNRERKRVRKEAATGLTSRLIKVSNVHKRLNGRLGIGRSMCRLVGKNKNVTAGLGVFAREGFYKFETICILDFNIVPAEDTSSPNILTRPDRQRVYAQGPSTSYAGFINDPNNVALENCEVVFDPLVGKYILLATTDVMAQHEVMMKH